jgi:hypothetical protein
LLYPPSYRPDDRRSSPNPHRRSQAQIISLCLPKSEGEESSWQRSKVAVHISHIATGECLARVDWHQHNRLAPTAVSYNDIRGDLVVGDEGEKLHIWSN